jgi:putative copper export protein
MSLYYVNLTVHILAAMVWLGGMWFFVIVGAPTLRRIESAELRRDLFSGLGKRFRTVGWICIGILLATGLANLYFAGLLPVLTSSRFWATPYGRTLALKLGAVGAMIVLSLLHDFFFGPRASRVGDETDTVRDRLRRLSSMLGRANALIGVLVVWLAVLLTRGG